MSKQIKDKTQFNARIYGSPASMSQIRIYPATYVDNEPCVESKHHKNDPDFEFPGADYLIRCSNSPELCPWPVEGVSVQFFADNLSCSQAERFIKTFLRMGALYVVSQRFNGVEIEISFHGQ